MAVNEFGNTKYYYLLVAFFLINCVISIVASNKLTKNIKIFTNTSNSMLPLINNGSLSVVKTQPMNSYEVGDVITFYQADLQKEVTHRIYRLGGNMYITKGDYNEAIDAQPVNPRLVIGKVIMVIPFFGYWVTFIKSQIGVGLIIVLSATIIVLTELSNIFLIQKSKK